MRTESYYRSERRDIIELVPSDVRRVLDAGCGEGLMCRRLKEKTGAEIVGIEKNEKVADTARANVDTILVGDVEAIELPFEKGYFDCIVYGDVLEHLKEPLKLLKRHKYYLRRDGICIASLPNVAHYSTVQSLLKNKWDYTSEGILDETHLRFFTADGAREMFHKAGYTVCGERKYYRASVAKRVLNRMLLGKIDHLLVEQFIIKARLV